MVGIGSGKFLGRRRVGREFEEFRRVDRVFQTLPLPQGLTGLTKQKAQCVVSYGDALGEYWRNSPLRR
jgi:hypothetical protein